MVNKQQIKDEIEKVREEDLMVIYRIIQALAKTSSIELSMQSETASKNVNWIQFIDQMYGCLSDDPIQRGDQSKFEIREIME